MLFELGLTRAPQYHATGTWETEIECDLNLDFTYQWQYYYNGWQNYEGETGSSMTKTLYYDPEGHDIRCNVTLDGKTKSDQIHVFVTGADRIVQSILPQNVVLDYNSPNPFNPNTQIKFGLPNNQKVKIDVYSITGQKVKTLINTTMNAGYHTINWNATDENGAKVSSGVYIYQLRCGNEVFTKKMIFAK